MLLIGLILDPLRMVDSSTTILSTLHGLYLKSEDAFFDYIGLGVSYLDGNNCSTFALEAHMTYDRELMAGDPMRFETQLLDHDAKRLHYMHAMYHAEEGYLASTNELISLHVDMTQRRSLPMPRSVIERLDQVAAAHRVLPRPPQAGRVISLGR